MRRIFSALRRLGLMADGPMSKSRGNPMKRVTLALALAGAALAFPSGASAYEEWNGPSSGALTAAASQESSSHIAHVEGSLTCKTFGGCKGGAEILVAPRMAKIVRRPQVKCREHPHSVTCTVVHPAVARFTRCKPKLGNDPELWNLEESVPSWERKVGQYGSKATAKDPPLRGVWFKSDFPQGTTPIDTEVRLPYGWRTPCFYLVSFEQITVPVKDCLPEFSQEVREELCNTEELEFAKLLSKRFLSVSR